MTFEEDFVENFPGLKGKVLPDGIDGSHPSRLRVKDVEANCLDRTKVKQVVEKHINTCIGKSSCEFTEPIEIVTCQEVILYELGLKDE